MEKNCVGGYHEIYFEIYTFWIVKYTFWIVAISLLTKSYSPSASQEEKIFEGQGRHFYKYDGRTARARAFVHVRDDYVDMRHRACVLMFNNQQTGVRTLKWTQHSYSYKIRVGVRSEG